MKKKLVGILVFIVAIGSLTFYFANTNNAIGVNTTEVVEGSIAKFVEEIGVVKAENQASIHSFVAGRVLEVTVEVGDQVKKGDVLVRLDKQEQERQIKGLEAQRTALVAQYQDAVKPIDNNHIQKIKLGIEDMERRLQETEKNFNNTERLYKAGAISQQEYQNTLLNLETEKINLDKVKLDLELIEKPMSSNVAVQYEAQLRQMDIQMEELKSRGADFAIIAPIDGTVMMRTVDEGSYIQPGVQVMEIGNTKELYIESDVLVGDIANIQEGSEVRMFNKNLNLKDLGGTIRKIHPQAFSKTSDLGIEQKRITVEIELMESLAIMRPGYDLDIQIIIDKKDNILLIPENVVFELEGKDFVFIVENDKAILREIKVGIESQRQVEVLTGLKKGDIIILSPNEKLEDGVSVKIQ